MPPRSSQQYGINTWGAAINTWGAKGEGFRLCRLDLANGTVSTLGGLLSTPVSYTHLTLPTNREV